MNAQRSPRVGPYQLLAKIGQGGMGSVHLAKMDGPSGFRKLAVVKELNPELLDSPDAVQLFLDEARLAARLTHPNVVHTYGADEDRGRLYIAMEYLDGQPWVRVRHRLWQNRSLPLATHLRVLSETLAALHYAHEATDYDGTPLHVVHCDVSPHNVFVTYEGQVKIVDFGVARAVTGTDESHKHAFAGKLTYAAPEQLSGEPLDRRVDIFAVGVMLWEALAGRPFVAEQDRASIMRRRIMGEEPRVREAAPTAPRALADMCDRATASSREERFATAAEFRHALIDYLAKSSPDTDEAQLARLVSTAFREERAEVQTLIEGCLRATPPPPPPQALSVSRPPPAASSPPVASASPSTSASHSAPASDSAATLPPPPLVPAAATQRASLPDLSRGSAAEPGAAENTMRADLSELASVSKLTDDAALVEASFTASVRPHNAARKRRTQLAAVGVGVAVVGLLALKLSSSDEPPRAPTKAAAVETVSLEIHVSPPQSELLLDGVKLASNPYRERHARDQREHSLRASAPGRMPQQWTIRFDRDQRISSELTPDTSAVVSAAPAPGVQPGLAPVLQPQNIEPDRRPAQAAPTPRRKARASALTPAAAPAPAVPAVAAAAAAPPSAPNAAPAAEANEPAFDERLTPTERAPRPIYEEDPYR